MFYRTLFFVFSVFFCGLGLAGEERSKPNVIFIIVDDLTTSLSCQNWPGARTPNMDALAARGLRFERAYCNFSVCNAARQSFLSGCYPETTRVMDLESSFRTALPDILTLPQQFQKHGYRIAAVGKVFHVPDPKTRFDIEHRTPLALDQNILHEAKQKDPADPPRGRKGRGRDYNLNYAASDRPDSDFTDYQLAERSIAALGDLKDGPFFLTIGFIRPHTPFVAPQWAFDAIDRSQIQLPPFYTDAGEDTSHLPPHALRPNNNVFRYEPPTREQALDARHAYLAAVHFVDHQIGRLLAELERLGLTEKTVIALTGDHGYHLGEHGLWAKQTLFESGNHVPLIFAGPGVQAGVRSGLAEHLDIYPTLCDLASLPKPRHLQGRSLKPMLDDADIKVRQIATSTMIAFHTKAIGHSLRTEAFRYIAWEQGREGEQLYDLRLDPHELKNLAADPGQSERMTRMRNRLASHLKRLQFP